MNNLIINSITIIFLIIIILYSVVQILINKSIYNFINEDYKNLNENYKVSLLYSNIKSKYNFYIIDNPNADINITTFVEEFFSEYKFKDKFVLDKIKIIKNTSSNCILLGVLGTFTGLSMMLLSINTNDIINSLPKTINSMQTAFITSIFGIVFSIVVNILLSSNDCEHILLQLMLKVENLLTSEITDKKSKNIDEKIEDVKNTIKEISISIKCIEKIDDISKDLIAFNKEFIFGINTLRNLLEGSQSSIKSFDQSVKKLDKQFSIMNMKFTKLFNTFENQEDINKEILLDIKETSKNIFIATDTQSKIKDYLINLSSNFALYERLSQDLLNKLIEHENKIIKDNKKLDEEQVNLDKTIKHLSSVIENSSNDINQNFNAILDYIDLNLSGDDDYDK